MILGDIRGYLKQRNQASLDDVANHFNISRASAEMALDYWISKGIIVRRTASCNNSCSGCGSSGETYSWLENSFSVKWHEGTSAKPGEDMT